jgi:hypothetical protein
VPKKASKHDKRVKSNREILVKVKNLLEAYNIVQGLSKRLPLKKKIKCDILLEK